MTINALVFNCHYNGLSVIQELGRRGLDVLALDCRRSVGMFSRYARSESCPDPMVAEEAFIQYLMDLTPRFHEKPVLFPTNDHWAAAVSRHKGRLADRYLPCVADWPTMQLLLEKDRFYTWSLERGYPVPRTWSGSEHRRIPAEAFPLVAKPTYRRISSDDPKANELSQQMDQLRLTIFWDRTELESFIRNQADVLDHLLVQEYVRGLSDSMYTIGVYADRQHEVLGMFTGRKVRGFPPDIGNCIVGQAEEMPHHLKDMVRELCRELAYHGIAEFEFKQDAITGEFKLIEVNPRSWSWVGITPACGVSLPWIAFADLSGAEPVTYTESSVPSGSAKWVILYEDLLNCLYFNRQEGYPEWHMSLRQWWHSLKAEHRVVADITFDDPLPGLYGAYATTRRALRKRMSLSLGHRHG